jgi:tetratricopeptide (TPR) repeat protein
MTGDILGTVRYMSPEQALAQRILIDHRTDIYSLGVTLYELLTLQPAFTGRDRQELLRQIAFEEPRLPRKVNPAIPAELETIVLKSVGKNPEQRYATAQELADDLLRFLEDKPIKAKRPSLIERAAKWSRRHRAVVAAGVVVLVMAVVALSVSTVLIWQEQARTQSALTTAQENLSEAEVQRERAEENFQKARDAVDKMLTRAADELKDRPHMEQVRRALLEDALEFYEGFLEERSSDPAVRYEAARAYHRVGDIYRRLEQTDEAEDAFRQAIALHAELVDDYPDSPDYRRELGDAHRALGTLLVEISRPAEGGEQLDASLQLCEGLVRDFPSEPEFRVNLIYAHLTYAHMYLPGDSDGLEQKERAVRRALVILEDLVREHNERDHRILLAKTKGVLGGLLRLDRPDEAEPILRDAIALQQELLDETPDDFQGQRQLAMSHNFLGAVLLSSRPDEAEEYFRRALEVGQKLAANHPDVPGHQSELGAQLHNLGWLLFKLGRHEEAAALLDQAIQHQRAAYELNPLNPQYAQFLRNHALSLASVLMPMGNHADAAMVACQASVVLPDDFYTQMKTAGALADCLRVAERDETLSATRRAAVMSEYADQARVCLRKADSLLPDDSAQKHYDLAQHLIDRPELRDPVRAVQLAERTVELVPGQGECWNMLGMARYRAGDWPGAIEALNKSVELRDGGNAYDRLFLAMAYWQSGDADEADDWHGRAIEWMAENPSKSERLDALRTEAAELMGIEEETVKEQPEKSPEKNPG